MGANNSDNVFSWIYYPPVYQKVREQASFGKIDYSKKLISAIVKSPEAKSYTFEEVNNALTPLKFGDKTQLELLAVLDFMQQAEKQEIEERLEFYVN